MEDDSPTSGEPIEEDLLRILPPDLLLTFQEEKARHREALKSIERTVKMTRARVKKWFYGPVLEKKQEELEREYQEAKGQEASKYAQFLEDLRKSIRDQVNPPKEES